MKIKVYGYYNYESSYDQKEHLTATPESIMTCCGLSGNVYEFDTTHDIKVYTTNYGEQVMTADGELAHIESKDGIAYLVHTQTRDYGYDLNVAKIEILGNIKKHLVKKVETE